MDLPKDGYWSSCPKCGAEPRYMRGDEHTRYYACGTIYEGGRCDSQSPACYKRQRAKTKPIPGSGGDDDYWGTASDWKVLSDESLSSVELDEVAAYLLSTGQAPGQLDKPAG